MFPETILNDTSSNQIHSLDTTGFREHQFVVVQEKLPEPGICFTWGGAHYKTFDGKVYRYSIFLCSHFKHVQSKIFEVLNRIVRIHL